MTQPRPRGPGAAAPAPATSRWDRPLTAALLALVAGGLGLLAGSRPWVRATIQDPLLGVQRSLTASGREAAPLVVAVALVALAGGVALLLARRLGRRVIGLVLVLAGAVEVAAALGAARQPEGTVTDQVAKAIGSTSTTGLHVTVTGWPWLAVAAGVLAVIAGALAVLRAHRWAGPRSRYDAPDPENRPAAPAEQADVPPADQPGVRPTDAAGTAPQTPPDPGQAWDALSRGEDPTD